MLTILLLGICGLLVTFILTFAIMPRIITFMRNRNIVGIDVHKLDKPEVAEMGGVGILVGVTGGCLFLFFGSGYLGLGFLDYRILVFLSVILLVGAIGIIDDLKTLGPRIKPILTAVACFPILISSWIIVALNLPLPLAFNPRPKLPFLGRARLTYIYQLIIPFGIAVPANAVNMLDVFNGVMPLTTILMFVAMLTVSLILVTIGVPGAELGILLSLAMIGALLAYYYFNRYPARVFSGDTGSLFIGAALGALAIIGQLEIVAIVALLPAIMNAFYSLVSVGGLLERRQMKSRPTVFQEDGTLAATQDKDAPITLTRLVLARGPLDEKRIIQSLAILSLASSVLAVITNFLIPLDSMVYLIPWPITLYLIVIPFVLVLGIYIIFRNKNYIGSRLAGLIVIMTCVWGGGMIGFALLDFLIEMPVLPWMNPVMTILRPLIGIVFMFGWLMLWHFTTRLYFGFESRRRAINAK
jgi:UDP-N-acetylglucosamine--dolichyl-phosphate N-acetylglucosaminephosphotransferase